MMMPAFMVMAPATFMMASFVVTFVASAPMGRGYVSATRMASAASMAAKHHLWPNAQPPKSRTTSAMAGRTYASASLGKYG